MEILYAILYAPVATLALLFVKRYPNLCKSYLFWSAFSLINIDFLGFLGFPPFLLILYEECIGKFLKFMMLPAGIAAAAAAITLAILILVNKRVPKWKIVGSLTPYIVNSVLLVAFLTVADIHKSNLIKLSLANHNPECFYTRSFFESIKIAGKYFYAHAMFVENGKHYYWSYSELSFFEGNDRLDRNFPCPDR